MNFKNVPKKYRPIPFWSWNEKLECSETKNQIKLMDEAGIGGFFMHARGGLETEYMGKDWFCNVSASVEEGKLRKMGAWAYDENGWPSGFGDGAVNGLGLLYQQKYLRMEKTSEHKNAAIAKCGEHYFYYEINPFYVDVLDKKVVAEFIKVAYEPYFEKYGNEIKGFFTDEPQISRNGIPWSFVFEEEYRKRYGENILEHLEELFLSVGDYKNTRVKFWRMVTELFSESFFKQVYDWCDTHGLKFTGHLVCEETIDSQLTSNGACMPHYEYFHIPGMDWLGRNIFDCLTPMQASSAAEQLGKKAVLSETFALCGHNVSFSELKGIFEWQMVHGINLLCQHLEGYSNRGIRKRDYPPAMYIQQPWWSEYRAFNDFVSRIGMVLGESKKTPDVLVLHPQVTAWSMYDCGENEGIDELNQKLLLIMRELEEKHIQYHLGDEILMERHARVKDGKIIIGEQSYSVLIDPGCEVMLDSTKKLLDEFKRQGGRIVSVGELPENRVIENKNITYSKREGDGFTVHYFVNTSRNTYENEVFVNGKMLDIHTGELKELPKKYRFEPWGSLLVIDDGNESKKSDTVKENIIRLPDKVIISEPVKNSITLDCCDYYFDGVLQEENGYVLNICERVNVLGRRVQIHQDYKIKAEFVPDELYLVCETPEIFKIFVNGVEIEKEVCGYFIDKSFKKIEISRYMRCGENTISFDCDFKQSDKVYENLKKAFVFESEKNKLSYDIEIEAIYLVGDFCVKTDGEWTKLSRNAKRYRGKFILTKPQSEICIKDIETQGYPFFAGEMQVSAELEITGENPILKLDRHGINAVRVEINGTQQVMLESDCLDLSEFGVSGKTEVKLTIINNLRNLLGPHHLKEGESYSVIPSSFFKEACVWNTGWGTECEANWDDDYCFAELSL